MGQSGTFTRTAVFTPDSTNYNSVEADVDVKVYKPSTDSGNDQRLPDEFTVKIDNGDGDESLETVKRSDKLKEPKNPEKEGYIFDGWYTDKDGNNKYDFDSKVTKDFTLYAKWVKDETAGEKNNITLVVGEKETTVFGERVTNDVAPVIVNSRTMLPARFVAEALGAKVYWDGETRRVTIIGTKNDKDTAILIHIDSDTAYVNGEPVKLDSPAFIKNDRTYLPVRFICEELGATVMWIESELKIVITK